MEFSIILCGDRTRNDLNLHSRLEDGVGWTTQKDYSESLFKWTCFTMCASFSWSLLNEHFRAGWFSSINIQRETIWDLFTKSRGKISLTFTSEQKVGNIGDCDAKGRVHFSLVMCLVQRKLNEPEKDLTHKLELPVQMYELQVNWCSSLK